MNIDFGEEEDFPLNDTPFTEEGVQNLFEFGKVLQEIHDRLVAEGVEIEVDEHYRMNEKPTD